MAGALLTKSGDYRRGPCVTKHRRGRRPKSQNQKPAARPLKIDVPRDLLGKLEEGKPGLPRGADHQRLHGMSKWPDAGHRPDGLQLQHRGYSGKAAAAPKKQGRVTSYRSIRRKKKEDLTGRKGLPGVS